MTVQPSQAIEVVRLIHGHKHDEGLLSFASAPVVLLGNCPSLVICALPAVFLIAWGEQHVQQGRPVRAGTNIWQFPLQGYRDSSIQLTSRQTLVSNCRRRCRRCRPLLPPPLLLMFDAHMGFRFRRVHHTGQTTFFVVPPPQTFPPLLQNKRVWLSTNFLILSKDAHKANREGIQSLLSGLSSLPSASLQSASI